MAYLRSSSSPIELHLVKTFLINLVGWSLIIPTVAFFAVYRKVIDIILKLKHGKLYGGLFNLDDGVFFWSDAAPVTLSTVLYIRSKNPIDLLTNVQKVLKEKIFKNPDLYPKLTGTMYSFGGYAYWMKYGCKPNNVVKVLKLPTSGKFNEEYLKKAAAEIVEAPIDGNNSVLWNFHISQKPLEDLNSDESYCYPIIARFHHSIADGTSLVALFIWLFGDTTAQNYSEELFRKLLKPSLSYHCRKVGIESLLCLVERCITTLYFAFDLIFFALGRVIQNCQLREKDDNALHSSKYSGRKTTVWATENESDCLPMVKRIKDRTKSKFTCVLGTAISASMTQYFKRNNFSVPNYTSGLITILLNFPSIDSSKPVPLENKVGALSFELASHTSNTLTDTLRIITIAMKNQLKYTDAKISYLLLRYLLGYIPIKLVDNYLGYESQTVLLTNIPGGSRIDMFDGCTLEKVIPIAPNVKGMGIAFGVISYDNKLQVGVTVDKTLISNPEEVQRIADDFFHIIRLLDTETKNKH